VALEAFAMKLGFGRSPLVVSAELDELSEVMDGLEKRKRVSERRIPDRSRIHSPFGAG
jgi:hypothetical protein